ncbi:MAG: SPOR domain-containing protein [Saprospiraceae bacterium]|nr:SPOR domain-containing protein [Saprospiraceae bacterium]
MTKLLLNITLILISDLFGPLHGQNTPNKGGGPAVHEARFMVSNAETKSPITQALLIDKTGRQLGQTDLNGKLVLTLPASDSEVYTVRAPGYNATQVKLTNASKKVAEYQVLMMELKNGKEVVDQTTQSSSGETEKVKVYVKQDPTTYKKPQGEKTKELEFAVQLSASSRPITDKSSLSSWEELGPVYIHTENGMYKVRIGPFDTQDKAKQVLLQAKARGKKDAFIVIQQGLEPFSAQGHPAGQSMEVPIEIEEKVNNPTPVSTVTSPAPVATDDDVILEYKVRLASYLKPGGFNTKDIDQYGPLESYRQGDWTIMLIGGFKTAKDAERVRDLVIAKGYKDAAVVVDKGGILESEY